MRRTRCNIVFLVTVRIENPVNSPDNETRYCLSYDRLIRPIRTIRRLDTTSVRCRERDGRERELPNAALPVTQLPTPVTLTTTLSINSNNSVGHRLWKFTKIWGECSRILGLRMKLAAASNDCWNVTRAELYCCSLLSPLNANPIVNRSNTSRSFFFSYKRANE